MAFILQTKPYPEANSQEWNNGGGGVKGSVEVQDAAPPCRVLQCGEVEGNVARVGHLESHNQTQTQVQALQCGLRQFTPPLQAWASRVRIWHHHTQCLLPGITFSTEPGTLQILHKKIFNHSEPQFPPL